MSEMNKRVFALITENEVFHKWYIDEDYDNMSIAALIYGLQSNPIVIDITDQEYDKIEYGWKYNGVNFLPPEE